MGPLDQHILKEDALVASENGFQLKFQSHWYRSLPLSCMDFNVKFNGEEVDRDNLSVEVNGNKYGLEELPELDKEWLFILDKGTLHVLHNEPLEKGKSYQLELKYDLFIPYILVGPEAKPLMASSVVHKKLICQ